jgi:hypothetical protein
MRELLFQRELMLAIVRRLTQHERLEDGLKGSGLSLELGAREWRSDRKDYERASQRQSCDARQRRFATQFTV